MKKIITPLILIILMTGCSDPITDNIQNNVNTINDLKQTQKTYSANNYINSVKAAYANYYAQNGQAPKSVNDLNVFYQGDLTGICNTDSSSIDYAIKIVDGYIYVYCGEYATYEGKEMPIY